MKLKKFSKKSCDSAYQVRARYLFFVGFRLQPTKYGTKLTGADTRWCCEVPGSCTTLDICTNYTEHVWFGFGEPVSTFFRGPLKWQYNFLSHLHFRKDYSNAYLVRDGSMGSTLKTHKNDPHCSLIFKIFFWVARIKHAHSKNYK